MTSDGASQQAAYCTVRPVEGFGGGEPYAVAADALGARYVGADGGRTPVYGLDDDRIIGIARQLGLTPTSAIEWLNVATCNLGIEDIGAYQPAKDLEAAVRAAVRELQPEPTAHPRGERVPMSDVSVIDVPCVVLRVSRLYRDGMDVDAVYDITHGWWRMGDKREQAEYALAVADGVVRGAFRILGWRARQLGDTNFHHDAPGKPRWGFDGHPAEELQHLIGLDVSALFPQGAANPVRYLNLENSDTVSEDEAGLDVLPEVLAPEQAPGELTVLCQRLAANPVLDLSLGSKELFHSNFLGWLFKADESFAREVLAPWTRPGNCAGHAVYREWHHLDLVVELPGCAPIVIENKVFSLPDELQLDGYARDNIRACGYTDTTNLLLSLTDPGWEGGGYADWQYVGYVELAEQVLEQTKQRRAPSDFVAQLVEHWHALVLDLQAVLALTGPRDHQSLLLDGDTRAQLETVRLHDAIEKARVRQLRHDVAQSLDRLVRDQVELSSAFGSAGPLLDAKIGLPDGSTIGWQLQGSQWRRFVVAPEELHGRTPAQRAQREAYAEQAHAAWFDLTPVRDTLPCAPAPSKAFKHYAPGFLYDYVRIPQATIADLKALALAETQRAVSYALRWGQ